MFSTKQRSSVGLQRVLSRGKQFTNLCPPTSCHLWSSTKERQSRSYLTVQSENKYEDFFCLLKIVGLPSLFRNNLVTFVGPLTACVFQVLCFVRDDEYWGYAQPLFEEVARAFRGKVWQSHLFVWAHISCLHKASMEIRIHAFKCTNVLDSKLSLNLHVMGARHYSYVCIRWVNM